MFLNSLRILADSSAARRGVRVVRFETFGNHGAVWFYRHLTSASRKFDKPFQLFSVFDGRKTSEVSWPLRNTMHVGAPVK